jgi:glyoxylase-like metal-dependent hydrolase (beta-lactamase superfamily II)
MSGTREWQPRAVEVAGWRITELCDGRLRLDGGAMWGVVPKKLWQERTPAALDNTIGLALRPFLCEREGLRVLVEGGIGARGEERWRALYEIEQPPTLRSSLARLGWEPEDITHVVASHAHFDHIGALVEECSGSLVPLCPRAPHFIPSVEVEVAKRPDHVRRASYRAEDVLPLEAAGCLRPLADGATIVPGLRFHEASGHSDGVGVFTFGDERSSDTAIFWSDVVPTTHHAEPAYIMAYDIDVPRSFASRSHWIERAAASGWTGLFYHDDAHAFARLERRGRRHVAVPISGALRP